MKRSEIKISAEEELIVKKLTDEELQACAKIASMEEAKSLRVVVKLLVEQGKNLMFMQSPSDPVKLAIRHSQEQGRILGVESFLRIIVYANRELERRNKVQKT